MLGALALLTALARLHTWHEPPATDVSVYAVIAHELRMGRWLYADVWDHKPPAIHATYWIAETLAGYGPGQIYLLSVAAALVTLLGVFVAGRTLGGRAGGLWAATFWALISGDIWVHSNQPNTEAFVNACLVWVVALLATPGRLRALAVGGVLALAVLYKPVAALPGVALLLAHVGVPPTRAVRRPAVVEVLLVAGAAAAVGLATLGYFASTGRWRALLDAVVVYNRFYAGSLTDNFWQGLASSRLFSAALVGVAPLAVLAGPGVGVGLRWGPRHAWGLLVAYLVATPVAVTLA